MEMTKITEAIKYPTYRANSSPTPSNKLVVCDKCNQAHWTIDQVPANEFCCNARMRKGTKIEYKEAKEALHTAAVATVREATKKALGGVK